MEHTIHQSPVTKNVRPLLNALLETVMLLEEKYSLNYVARIVRGDENLPLKKAEHAHLKTFGVAPSFTQDFVVKFLYWLLNNGLLTIRDAKYGLVGISRKGREELEMEGIFELPSHALDMQSEDRLLVQKLKELRRQVSEKEQKPLYSLYSDFVMMQIVAHRPTDLQTLRAVPGIDPKVIEVYGYPILKIVEEAPNEVHNWLAQEREKKVQNPSVQAVKSLFLAGMPAEKIAEIRSIKLSTVIQYLCELHHFGQVNLRAWIEKTVDKKQLHKATEFFEQVENPRLREAYETLGLDYDTLRLCRLYVSKVQQGSAQLRIAG